MRAAERRDGPTTGSALDEAERHEIRLVAVLDCVRLLAKRRGERIQPDRSTAVLLRDRPQQLAVESLQACLVHLEQLERLARDGGRDRTLVPNLGDVADPTQD